MSHMSLSMSDTEDLKRNELPSGWFLSGGRPDQYKVKLDRTTSHSGTQSACMENVDDNPEDFGTLMQECSPDSFLNKRVRLTCWIKTSDVQDWVGAWFSVYGQAGRINISFDNMCNRKISGTTDWTKYELVLEVPHDASKLAFGVILNGSGKLWFDDLSFDVVTREIELTDCPCSQRSRSNQPRNLKFES